MKLLMKLGLVLLVTFLLFSRLYLLGSLPATIPHDELVYAVQAKSYAVFGATLNQEHRPWFLTPFDHMYAEIPASLMSLGFLVSDNPLIGTHLTSALMGLSLPFVLAWLVWGLFQNRAWAMGVFVVAVFNPLLWQFSRLGYDAWYSLWFYLLGAALYVQRSKKLQWLSAILFGLGFFNYQGFKLLLFPWLTVLFLCQFSFKKWRKQLFNFSPRLLVLTLGFALTLFYGLVLLPKQARVSERLADTIFTNTAQLSQQVDLQRRQVLTSSVSQLFANKGLATLDFMLSRLANAFSPNLLFLMIEPAVSGFSVWRHGIYYWWDGVLILIGVSWLIAKEKTRWQAVTILLSIPVLCLPTLINAGSEWHLLRTMLSYTLLIIFAGVGLSWIWQQRRLRWLFLPAYLLAIVNFSYIYFFSYPVISLDWANYHERLVSRYISLTHEIFPDKKISVHVAQSDYFYWNYLLFGQKIVDQNQSVIKANSLSQKTNQEQRFEIDNVVFTGSCQVDDDVDIIIAESSFRLCKEGIGEPFPAGKDDLQLVAVLDSGEKMYILGDQLCQGMKLNNFVHPTHLDQLNVEKLNRNDFCVNWVVDQ